MFLSPRTVETHLSAAFRKLQVRNRRELAGLAVREPALRADTEEASVPGVSG